MCPRFTTRSNIAPPTPPPETFDYDTEYAIQDDPFEYDTCDNLPPTPPSDPISSQSSQSSDSTPSLNGESLSSSSSSSSEYEPEPDQPGQTLPVPKAVVPMAPYTFYNIPMDMVQKQMGPQPYMQSIPVY